jgi:hypothetical protein
MKPETKTVFKVTIIGSSTAISFSKLIFIIEDIRQISLIRISFQNYPIPLKYHKIYRKFRK